MMRLLFTFLMSIPAFGNTCDQFAIVDMARSSRELENQLVTQVEKAGDENGRYFYFEKGGQIVPIAIIHSTPDQKERSAVNVLRTYLPAQLSVWKRLLMNPIYRMPSMLSLVSAGATVGITANWVGELLHAPGAALSGAAIGIGVGVFWKFMARLSDPSRTSGAGGFLRFGFSINRLLRSFAAEIPKFGQVPFVLIGGDIHAKDAPQNIADLLRINGINDAKQIDAQRFRSLVSAVSSLAPDFTIAESLTVNTYARDSYLLVQSGDLIADGSSHKLLFLSAFGNSLQNPLLHLNEGERVDLIYLRNRGVAGQVENGDFPVGFMIESAKGESRLYFPTVNDVETKNTLRNFYYSTIGKKHLVDPDFNQRSEASKFIVVGRKIQEATQKEAVRIKAALEKLDRDLDEPSPWLNERAINDALLEVASRDDMDPESRTNTENENGVSP